MRFFQRHHTNVLNVVLVGLALAWLGYQVSLPPAEQPAILNYALQATFGAWLTNLAYEQRHKEERIEHRVGNIEGSANIQDRRINNLESMASTVHPDDAEQAGVPTGHPDESGQSGDDDDAA